MEHVWHGQIYGEQEKMSVRFHPHALSRMQERSAGEDEVVAAIEEGESFPAKHGRTGFRRNFAFHGYFRGKFYHSKQIEAYAIQEGEDWLTITVITRFF